MAAFLELLQMAYASVFIVLLSPIFWLVMYLIYRQYQRSHKMEILILGEARKPMREKLGHALFLGMLGGLMGTVFIMLLGITVNMKDFAYIFPLALLLMFINMRFVCFSYAGGLLALSNLLFGFPSLNVSSILAIVAVLHLIESILMWFDGYKDAIPIFLKDSRFGIVGGFHIQRFWPIPFAVLLAVAGPLSGAKEISLPDWWPLFKQGMSMDHISLQITAVVAALGYGDMAVANAPKDKSRKAAKRLVLYGTMLLILAALSTGITAFKYLAAIFALLGHEAIILYGQREERNGIPIFRNRSHGITVLDVRPQSVGWRMKLQQGDIILKINNRQVHSCEEIQEVLNQYPTYLWLEVQDMMGFVKTLEHKDYQRGIHSLGLVLVPKESEIIFEPKPSFSLVMNFHKRFFKNKDHSI